MILVLQPEFVIFIAERLVVDSGRPERMPDVGVARPTSATGARVSGGGKVVVQSRRRRCHDPLMDTSSFAAILGPPPAVPVPVDWDVVEAWLGLALPGDYKSVASAYGPLDVGEFVWLHTPCVQEGRFDYATWLRETHRECRISSRQAPPYAPPAFHPAPGGLLAWGMTRSVSYLFWDTAASDDPDRWPVVIFHQDAVYQRVKPWHSYQMPLLDTLSAAVHTGLPLPGGGRIGPLPATARRTAFLTDVGAWAPPESRPEVVPEAHRRAALTEGTGLH
jgi:hypothetical protein